MQRCSCAQAPVHRLIVATKQGFGAVVVGVVGCGGETRHLHDLHAVPPAPKTLRKQTLHLDPQQCDRRSPREDASLRICHRGNRLWEMQEPVAQSAHSRCSFRNRRSPSEGGQWCAGAKHFNVIRRAVSGLCQNFHQFRKQVDLRLEVVHLDM